MPRSSGYRARRIKELVDRRDGEHCRRCGHLVWGDDFSRHHRIPRGAGGSARVDRVSNILKLCGSATTGCHGWIEKHRADAEILGYLLPKLNPDIDPETEPIFIHEFGWVLLGDNGSITPCPEPRREVS
jgi:hypothetical protein